MKKKLDNKTHSASSPLPTAMVLASSLIKGELVEIFGGIESSSLMIAGRAVIEHVLLELHDLGFDQCIILADNNASSIQELVESNGSWEMTVTVMKCSLSKQQVLSEFKSLSEASGMLIIETDKFRGRCVETFLNEAQQSDYLLLDAICAQGKAGLTLLKPTKSDFIVNAMPIYIDGLRLGFFNSAKGFHACNLGVISNKYSGTEPSVGINKKYNRRQHWASNVSTKEQIDWSGVMIDEHCQIGREVSLDSVVINHDVYIENKASISSAVIMSNQIISSQQKLNNVIVSGGNVFQL